ncbi:DotH/IcmK family type IV secretion protein [Acidisphaera sp. L21]|uniref:DotH/IcmK family type IV secretion protein n=1 Tax=Acidisphaera sp. L21 TaxID=1641851 RepID=UPI00131B64A4|nr:DotH/IcmK family type IV secretion protein [Acidisphaera sp. L21]
MRPSLLAVLLLVGGLAPVASFAQDASSPSTAPPPTTPADPGLSGLDPAGQRAVRNAIPLTPDMIQELERRYGAAQQAQEQATQQVASPVSRMVSVTFAPGQATSIIQTVRGYPTAISFFDATGQPWPIGWNTNSNAANVAGGTNCNSSQAVSGGDGSPSVNAVGFYVCVPVKGSNTIEITPMSLVPRGGLVVNLQNGPKPLSFLMIAGRDRYDADMSIHVSDRGPNAKVMVDTRPGAPVTGAPYLNAMLAGIAPAEAVPLNVSGVSPDEVMAWRLGGETYIRTRYTLMSPAWDASESGEGGTTIYAIQSTPVVLLSADSQTISAELKDAR